MRRFSRCLYIVLALTAFTVSSVEAKRGGPDSGGYTWVDSEEQIGEQIQNDDWDWLRVAKGPAVFGPVDLPWAFPLYGQSYGQFWISDNGWLSFVDPSGDGQPTNTTLPDPGPPAAMVAPLWDAMGIVAHRGFGPVRGGEFYRLEWAGAQTGPPSAPARVYVTLYPAGCIRFEYQDSPSIVTATVGIEDETGTVGTQLAFDGSNPASLPFSPSYAVAFCPPAVTTCGSLSVTAGNELLIVDFAGDLYPIWMRAGGCATRILRSTNKDFSSPITLATIPPDEAIERNAVPGTTDLVFYQLEFDSCFVCAP